MNFLILLFFIPLGTRVHIYIYILASVIGGSSRVVTFMHINIPPPLFNLVRFFGIVNPPDANAHSECMYMRAWGHSTASSFTDTIQPHDSHASPTSFTCLFSLIKIFNFFSDKKTLLIDTAKRNIYIYIEERSYTQYIYIYISTFVMLSWRRC